MKTDDLDLILSAAKPIDDSELFERDFGASEELLSEILAAGSEELDPRAVTTGRPRSLWSNSLPKLALAVACLVGAIVVATLVLGLAHDSDEPAYAESAIKFAENNRRLLVTEPGWHVNEAIWQAPDYGEVTFSNGGFPVHDVPEGHPNDYLTLHWYPLSELRSRTNQYTHGPESITATFEGEPTTIYLKDQTNDDGSTRMDFSTALPPDENSFVIMTGAVADHAGSSAESQVRTLIESLETKDVDSWLAAMPASVVKPDDRGDVVESMLEGIPVPSGFDTAAVESSSLPQDHYQLAAEVTGRVTCAWLDQWTRAQANGDTASAQEAVDAMATVKSWPILQDIASQGGWDEAVEEYAKRLASGDVDKQIYDQEMNCIDY